MQKAAAQTDVATNRFGLLHEKHHRNSSIQIFRTAAPPHPRVPNSVNGVRAERHPVLPAVWERVSIRAELSPLGGRVGIQHAAPLHPAPDGVHASQRLLLQAAAAPLDAVLDPKH